MLRVFSLTGFNVLFPEIKCSESGLRDFTVFGVLVLVGFGVLAAGF
jgi:hypothetical protein